MIKQKVILLVTGLVPLLAQAQWTSKDSLDLIRILKSEGEIQLNKNTIQNIDFGTFIGAPKAVNEKQWLDADVTLPKVFPEKVKQHLTLQPYKPTTKFNYDPIYKKKINITKDTWRTGDEDAWGYGGKVHMKVVLIPSNWAKTPFDPGIRKSIEEIEATGLRYNPLGERVNNAHRGEYRATRGPTGNDFMAIFTKDFWDKKGRERRKRTLELLQNYGDSTTILIQEEIKKTVID